MIDRIDAGNIERATFQAVAAADAIVADEIDDAVGVLHDGPGRRTRLQATRILAMHTAILADQPFEIALLVVIFGEAHQRPHAGGQIHWIVVGALEVPDLRPQIIPFHAGGLARPAADTASDIDQLGDFL